MILLKFKWNVNSSSNRNLACDDLSLERKRLSAIEFK